MVVYCATYSCSGCLPPGCAATARTEGNECNATRGSTWHLRKNSILNALEYRLSFTIWSIATICYAIVYVASIQFIFAHVQTIGGWRLEQMLVLAATVMIVDGIVESIFGENMNALSGLINRGELDFVLSKPVNTRFYVSTRKFDWDPLVQVVIGCGLLWYAIGLLAAANHVVRRAALPGAGGLRVPDCLFALV